MLRMLLFILVNIYFRFERLKFAQLNLIIEHYTVKNKGEVEEKHAVS